MVRFHHNEQIIYIELTLSIPLGLMHGVHKYFPINVFIFWNLIYTFSKLKNSACFNELGLKNLNICFKHLVGIEPTSYCFEDKCCTIQLKMHYRITKFKYKTLFQFHEKNQNHKSYFYSFNKYKLKESSVYSFYLSIKLLFKQHLIYLWFSEYRDCRREH